MNGIETPRRLAGKSVFLSASVPDPSRDERFQRIQDAPFQIEQAVISLARAVFSEGGRLVFGGHPSISPLVATVAGEYRVPVLAETSVERLPPQVVIYQSELFRKVIPHDTDLLIQLGLAEEHWTKPVGGEQFVPGEGSAHEQCPKSLEAMRRQMLADTRPSAMVCIGGMEGVLLEAGLYGALEDHGPVFTLERTGGAAALFGTPVAKDIAALPELLVEPIDLTVMDAFDKLSSTELGRREGEIDVLPYPLIMQTVVDRIAPPPAIDGRRHD